MLFFQLSSFVCLFKKLPNDPYTEATRPQKNNGNIFEDNCLNYSEMTKKIQKRYPVYTITFITMSIVFSELFIESNTTKYWILGSFMHSKLILCIKHDLVYHFGHFVMQNYQI